ncbi:VTT domain-containing protein, partial [Candidatus Bathyarchaeota archaeon]|nr:VTT domain-containing protein [Candidatus Bathyarchaeota archaeon]
CKFAYMLGDWINYLLQFSYLGVFLISLVGAMSIIVPIPYTFVILTLGIEGTLDPLLLTVAGGLGSAIGEFSGYVLGYYGRALISEKRRRKIDFITRILKDRYGPIAIFLFALTPLPDDLLFIPLGVLRYKFVKAFVPSFLGKLTMCAILAYGGQLYYDVLRAIFGGGTFEIELITSIITAILLVLIFVAMFKIDWEKILEKYMGKESERKS